ncbi:MAG: tRNA dihydrouridine synthase DusB [Bdellovibrionota bacterium]
MSKIPGIRIGDLHYDRALFMGPMEGITDVPFRKLIRKHGCGITCTQMIHAEGLLRGFESRRMQETSCMTEQEHPVGFQLAGCKPDIMAEAAKKVQSMGASFIDINMGCPAKSVVANGSGSALLQKPSLAAEIVKAMKKEVSIPITAKIRAGWNESMKNYLDMGALLEEAGVALVSVHARTRAQKFSGHANWDLIAQLKKHLSIPVVGNGDVFFPEDVEDMFDQTQADGVMMARGVLGNPWLFSQTIPTVENIYQTLFDHLDDHLSFYEHRDRAMLTFRKHIVWYTHGLSGAAKFRKELFGERDNDVLLKKLKDFFEKLDPQSTPDQHERKSQSQ